MTESPNELTIENSAVVLIDHQAWVAFGVESTSPKRSLLNDVVLQHGGGVGLSAEYMIAQISARLVPAPARPTEPARYAA